MSLQLRSSASYNFHRQDPIRTPHPTSLISIRLPNPSPSSPLSLSNHTKPTKTFSSLSPQLGGDDGNGASSGGRGRGGGGGDDKGSESESPWWDIGGFVGLFINGWRSRVAADPQLPFKLISEQVVGLSSCVLGDMATRPNFGLNELDFVFSTLVVGALVNVVLIYVLAPTATAAAGSSTSIISSIFSTCPKGHMFESGSYTVLDRFGTLIYKGVLFSAVGFAAGLMGTAISNGLIKVRKKMDPDFETPNKPPPTVLNALTWAAHMGLSCNLRYQTLTGVEFLLAKGLPPLGFKASVIALRCLNNIFGGVTFVMMARLTGSQQKAAAAVAEEVAAGG